MDYLRRPRSTVHPCPPYEISPPTNAPSLPLCPARVMAEEAPSPCGRVFHRIALMRVAQLPGTRVSGAKRGDVSTLCPAPPLGSMPTEPCVLKRGSRPQKAIDFISTKLHRRLTNEEIAWNVGCSVRSLFRTFREALGHSPNSTVRAMKMESAARMLRDTDTAIKEIAARVGHKNLGSFSRAFVACYGMPPAQYRASDDRWRYS